MWTPARSSTCPVEVAGALFSVGDTHAAQGDGEVCGTAIESPMNVVLSFDLVTRRQLKTPRFTTSGPVVRHLDGKGYEVTTGIGPDLMEAAPRGGREHDRTAHGAAGIEPVDAYMLGSVCGDLRISEIVDQPNWVVSFLFSADRARVIVDFFFFLRKTRPILAPASPLFAQPSVIPAKI